ncbi:MAG: sodium:solute symporter family protein [Saprospiraceae bacterium]|nr:sodium:solute symporter family protein [Saprospiraceae bacterium]
MVYVILISYLVITFIIGLIFTKKPETNPESYFLSNRNLKTIAVFFTLIATNFSAFFFLGFAGEGYRVGYAYYPIMALGTSFAAISFYVIGNKAWKLGKKHGYITPVEIVRGISGNSWLTNLYMVVMVGFMIPFLSVQPIGAGLILETITGGQIPYTWGVILMTIFIIIYVYIGGMRGVVAMDMKNGVIMLTFMVLALVVIASGIGGMSSANIEIFETKQDLFTPEGTGGFYTPLRWISFMILWMTCLPMFPQIFTRFLISRDLRTFKISTFLYTLIPPFLFLIPVAIGVLGHINFPDLAGKTSDRILPMMLSLHAPEWLAALILTGALAAFISTVDSLLLAISTIGTRDIYLKYLKPEATHKSQVQVGRLFILVVAIVSLVLALLRPASIFKIVTMTFSGSALLFPVTVALFYWKRVSPAACTLALLVGEVFLAGLTFDWIGTGWMQTALPVLPAMVLTILIIVVGSLVGSRKRVEFRV